MNRIAIPDKDRERLQGNEQEIVALADRIKHMGLVQPIVLNRAQEGQYRTSARHMRVEACKRLRQHPLPASVKDEE